MMYFSNTSSQDAAGMIYYSKDGAVQKWNLEYIQLHIYTNFYMEQPLVELPLLPDCMS